ncbi:MAG: hypothetical protein AAGI71_11290 [Bacteroidota bacterium]
MPLFRLLALLTLVLPLTAQAQLRLGGHLGLTLDGTDLFAGVAGQLPFTAGTYDLVANPSFEAYPFVDGSISRINLDVLYPLTDADRLWPYVGGGILVHVINFPDDTVDAFGETGDTDVGLNLKAGLLIRLEGRPYRLFGELVQTLGGGTTLSLRTGLYFTLGG